MFATESDLQDFLPDIFQHGLNNLSLDISNAEEDVINLIKSSWWNEAIRSSFIVQSTVGFSGFVMIPLDPLRLNSAVLKKLTIYRAASGYIYPKLATFKDIDGDSFSRKAEFYKQMYIDEFLVIKHLPLYDFNKDNNFSDLERKVNGSRRLLRA